jgi:hypothetical protein
MQEPDTQAADSTPDEQTVALSCGVAGMNKRNPAVKTARAAITASVRLWPVTRANFLINRRGLRFKIRPLSYYFIDNAI